MKNFLVCIIVFIYSTLLFSQNESAGKISGLMFGDYFYNVARDTAIASLPNVLLKGNKDLNGFQFRRIYFTYDYKISSDFKTRFRIEADQSDINNNKIGIFVKDAYLSWNSIFDGSDLVLGIQPTPAFQISESFWGYRSLEKTILDLRGIVSSRDFAVSLNGKLISDGSLNYWVMFGNGSGNSPEMDKYKRYYLHLNFNPTKNLSFTFYGDFKSRPQIMVPVSSGKTLSNNDFTYDFFVGYKEKEKFSVGAETFITVRENGSQKTVSNGIEYSGRNTLGVSVFGNFTFSPLLEILGRYDYFDPNIDGNVMGDSRNFFIFGLSYNPDSKVSIIPNVLLETYEQPSNENAIDPSVTARVTFYYKFL